MASITGNTRYNEKNDQTYLRRIKRLIETKAMSGSPFDINVKYSPHGNTLLHTMAGAGHIQCVRYLMESGADIHALDAHGNTILHLAVSRNNLIDLVQYLLDCGADRDAMNAKGLTAADMALDFEYYNLATCIDDYDMVPVKGVNM